MPAMTTHPLWRPFEQPTPEEIARARVRPHQPAPVEVVAPDPRWPAVFERLRARIEEVLGARALAMVHIGSTSVTGLWAKPVIDVDLEVADSADEPAWLPDLEADGFVLAVREPDWEEHRCLKLLEPSCNLHVWSPGSSEMARHQTFRDWLIEHPDDRTAYGDLKRELSGRGFEDAMLYNNAKGALVYDIYERIFAADPAHPHTPRPRPV